jgi:hypothetical protein
LDVTCYDGTGSPITLDSVEFIDGFVQNSIDIKIDENGSDILKVSIPKGTQFEDSNRSGNYIETIPRYFISQSKTNENVIKLELKFIDESCNRIFPTKPLGFLINVSKIAQANDPVIIGMPDGSFRRVAVDSRGYINFILPPELFIKENDILVIVISLFIITGAEGGTTGAEGGN